MLFCIANEEKHADDGSTLPAEDAPVAAAIMDDDASREGATAAASRAGLERRSAPPPRRTEDASIAVSKLSFFFFRLFERVREREGRRRREEKKINEFFSLSSLTIFRDLFAPRLSLSLRFFSASPRERRRDNREADL